MNARDPNSFTFAFLQIGRASIVWKVQKLKNARTNKNKGRELHSKKIKARLIFFAKRKLQCMLKIIEKYMTLNMHSLKLNTL